MDLSNEGRGKHERDTQGLGGSMSRPLEVEADGAGVRRGVRIGGMEMERPDQTQKKEGEGQERERPAGPAKIPGPPCHGAILPALPLLVNQKASADSEAPRHGGCHSILFPQLTVGMPFFSMFWGAPRHPVIDRFGESQLQRPTGRSEVLDPGNDIDRVPPKNGRQGALQLQLFPAPDLARHAERKIEGAGGGNIRPEAPPRREVVVERVPEPVARLPRLPLPVDGEQSVR